MGGIGTVLHHADHDTVLRIWRHHEQRRRDGLPTLSVHVGTEGEWSRAIVTLEGAGHRVVRSSGTDLSAITRDWLRAISASYDVLDEAFGFVAHALGVSQSELQAAWAARSDSERVRWIAQLSAQGGSELRAALDTLRSALDADNVSAICLDTLLLWWPASKHIVWCVEGAELSGLRALLGLAADKPTWPLLVSVSRQAWPGICAALDERSRSWLESSVLPCLAVEERAQPQSAEETLLLPPVGVRRLVETIDASRASQAARESPHAALQERAAEALSEAQLAHESRAPERDLLEERARSLAEQRLFELLAADPLTRGLFELNRALPFSFGTRAAEPDLVSLQLRLVLEVDGYYHFQGPDAYRRDRRKDVLLQQHGYLVSRHLASDIATRAGEVMRAIRELVTQRRKSFCTENAS